MSIVNSTLLAQRLICIPSDRPISKTSTSKTNKNNSNRDTHNSINLFILYDFFFFFFFFFFIDWRLWSSPYSNMGVWLTAIPVRRRRSQLPISKETLYTTRSSRESRATIGGVLAIPEELDTINPLRQGLRNGILIVLEIFILYDIKYLFINL